MIRFLALLLVLTCANAAAAETIAIGGTTRKYALRLPDTKPAPLVIVLHGNTQSGADMITRTAWPAVAKREGFAVVFPDGLNHSWADLRPVNLRAGRVPPHGTDDVAFIAKLIERLVADGSADPKRIYVTGISNGGAMTMTLVCKRADLFAGAASVAMSLTDQSANPCRPARPVPMLMMNGTADPLVPFKGGRGTSRFAVDRFWPAEKTLSFWRRNNGCEAKDAAIVELDDADHGDRSTVTRIESKCPPGRDVVLYRVNDGGHRMPGSPDARFPRLANTFLGPQNRDIDGAEAIWAFFKKSP
ncbi:alpha/beta hydrolase family esterase [Bradyrhizobium sp.]|uniref:alpha/beta hydrolase family esterase n=1 Tax=Bradyrhizobium sp. TaxID=376 RepID=UPI0040384090